MSLYKYTNIKTATLILNNKSLRWSSPIIFNDLEECQFVPFTKEDYENAFKNYIEILTEYANGRSLNYNFSDFSNITKTLIQFIRLSINQGTYDKKNLVGIMLSASGNSESDYRNYINTSLIKCFRVLCVTEHFDKKLMWTHYADQNYGCVIEFEHLYNEKPKLLREGYVRYHENLEPKSKPLDMLIYGETEGVRDLMIKDVIFSKRTLWNYEEEYRLMFAENFGHITSKMDMQTLKKETTVKDQTDQLYTDVNFPKESIKSMIFGVRTTAQDIKVITDLLTENSFDCKLYKMKIEDGQLIKEKLI